MTENKHEALDEELNGVAEYAGLSYVFEVEPAENPQQSIVKIRGIKETWLVDTIWCTGNAKRLPDKASKQQMIHCLRVSHPDVMGVSDKHYRREQR